MVEQPPCKWSAEGSSPFASILKSDEGRSLVIPSLERLHGTLKRFVFRLVSRKKKEARCHQGPHHDGPRIYKLTNV